MTKLSSRLVLALATFCCSSLGAQDWSGSIGIAAAARNVSGSDASFRSQTNLRSGFALDELTLRHSQFSFTASGFGNAEPTQTAQIEYRFRSPLTLRAGYDRRNSFFNLSDSFRTDDWNLTRFNAGLVWDGWQAGRLTVDLRQLRRGGSSIQPYYALNSIYPVRIGLADTQRDATIRFDTRGYPFRFAFEQTFSRADRHDRYSAAGPNAIDLPDPDTLLAASNLRDDRQNMPTTRVVLSTESGGRIEAVGSAVWSPSRLRSTGPVTTTFGINGGNAGSISFIDNVAMSANRDVVAGNARVAILLAPRWIVRMSGDYRDSSTDATLLGTRLLRMVNPQGLQTEFSTNLATVPRSVFDFTDGNARVEIERRGEHLVLHAGAIGSQRDFAAVHRRSTGATAGLSWRNTRWSGAADFEHGTFEHFIFRTDPEKVDRLRLRGAVAIRPTLQLQADGRFERGQNPQAVAALDHRSNFAAVDLVWLPGVRDASAGFNVSSTQIHTRTDLVLPGNVAGLSDYQLNLLAATAHGRYALGRTTFTGSVTRTRDNGSTWPLTAWNAAARATMRLSKRFDAGVFGDYWSYNERLASADDFNATRYGVLLVWRFE